MPTSVSCRPLFRGYHQLLTPVATDILVKPTERFAKAEKGQRRVRDPITGSEIIVKDADPKGESLFFFFFFRHTC